MGEEISKLNIEPGLLITNLPARNSSGRSFFVVLSDELQRVLADRYGRKNLCLKICREKPVGPEGKPRYRFQERLRDAVTIQNLFAYEGLAPRVYDFVLLNGSRFALVMDFIRRDTKHRLNSRASLQSEVFPRIEQLMEELGLCSGRRRLEFDTGIRNFVNGKLVDFNGFFFKSTEARRQAIMKLGELEAVRNG